MCSGIKRRVSRYQRTVIATHATARTTGTTQTSDPQLLPVACSFIGGQLLFAPSTLALLPALLKVVLLAVLAPLLMPLLLFQIDVRRPAVQFITATLCALFIGTAILASWFSMLLYPLLRWYALQYSNGRFYRA